MKPLKVIALVSVCLFGLQLVYAQSESSAAIDNTNYYLVFATLALVGVTIYYAIMTNLSVSATKESTAAQFLPYIVATISNLGPVGIALEIANIGKGGAKGLSVDYRIQEIENSEKRWYQAVLRSESSQVFYLERGDREVVFDVDFFKNNQTTLDIRWSCKDVFGKEHTGSDTLDITSFVRQFDNINAQYKKESLDSIDHNIREFITEFKRLKQDIDKIKNDTNDRKHSERTDHQIRIAKDRIQRMRIHSRSKQHIINLVEEIGIILRENRFPSEDTVIVSKLEEIKNAHNEAFNEILVIVLELRSVRGIERIQNQQQS